MKRAGSCRDDVGTNIGDATSPELRRLQDGQPIFWCDAQALDEKSLAARHPYFNRAVRPSKAVFEQDAPGDGPLPAPVRRRQNDSQRRSRRSTGMDAGAVVQVGSVRQHVCWGGRLEAAFRQDRNGAEIVERAKRFRSEAGVVVKSTIQRNLRI